MPGTVNRTTRNVPQPATRSPAQLPRFRAQLRRQRTRCFVALGSNMNQPLLQLRRAVQALDTLPQSSLQHCSSVYRSQAMGPGQQPDYLNAVAEIRTALRPHALLAALKRIERRAGRVYQRRWSARPLDLDILLYGHLSYRSRSLTIPHAGLMQRNFVLGPLLEIAAGLALPNGRALDTNMLQGLPGRLQKMPQPLWPRRRQR
ncbi:MAG: 2-amino-4-hydroxy-6-hydroxymethyldihydropteridine diphosphokinase [Gammaproteobacteria bacterium]|nr:2-amino-4-hydroxy-6-hydroxymethyldihydropteridine diphosphokinase [Gammaproteobacteria bacterium]NND38436.1 2-amino-4-hydroxy-6-hydroxymethyldihydropteridine diphosphokinase [Pseudomonadales bacterium]RZV58495.1 MAG: 2-amino-4-hydroxy-6-hydroxymethyldihydropteridine diphosphokinase [Pseudomonadales bacterium]